MKIQLGGLTNRFSVYPSEIVPVFQDFQLSPNHDLWSAGITASNLQAIKAEQADRQPRIRSREAILGLTTMWLPSDFVSFCEPYLHIFYTYNLN